MKSIQKKITKINFTKNENKTNSYIVIHYVGAVSSARANASYFYTEYRASSAHYFVDEKEIWQVVEDNNNAWHVGLGKDKNGKPIVPNIPCYNNNSIGIELCCKQDKNARFYFEPKTLSNAAELTANLMKKYNIDIDHLVMHFHIKGKLCPEPFVRDANAWQEFKNMVDVLLNDKEEEEVRYKTLEEIPEWGRATVKKLLDIGIINGSEKDNLNLSEDIVRILVINDRAKLYD